MNTLTLINSALIIYLLASHLRHVWLVDKFNRMQMEINDTVRKLVNLMIK